MQTSEDTTHVTQHNTVPKFLARFSESSSSSSSISHTPSMAANRFATLLHRNTNPVVVTLVYAVLEWVLILLLLLNSLFSYLITKFAKWVGLKPPCLLCSRLDHVLEPEKKCRVLQSDVVCETHAAEISKMGFCSIHGKMAETQSMCEDCLVSIRGMAFVSWFCEKSERCSCCDKSLRTTYTSKETLIVEASDDDDDDEDDEEEEGDRECDHRILFDVESFILREVAEDRSNSSVSKDAEKDEKEDDLLIIKETDPISESHTNLLRRFSESVWEDRSLDCISMHLETNVDDEDQRVIPVELIDSFTSANFEPSKSEEVTVKKERKIETLASEPSIEEEISMAGLENHMVLEEDEELKNDGDNTVESAVEKQDDEQALECTQEDQCSSSDDDAEVQNAFDEFIAQNHLCQSQSFCGDNNIETTLEEADDAQANLPHSEQPSCSCECIEDDQSLTSDDDAEVPDAFDKFISQNNLCLVETGANDNDHAEPSLLGENHEETNHHQSSKSSEEDEVEEDKLPETPSSVDGLHYLHKKLLLYEKTESGAAEDSVDGSEIENSDSLSTIEQLKTALKAERKALSALYQELEEERSASAIAANQTMAMITRLQEEKAAVQMEALQYQRMMEEQSEYDQEALQLLNDLMVKREREKKELEKELEEYKQKVMDFEAREKLRVLRRMKNGSDRSRESSSSPSLGEDAEEQSIDLNCEPREEEDNINTTTSIDTVSSLEEMTMDCLKHMNALDSSLAEFEEEKLSILDQLKALEEKLINLGDKEQLLDDLNQNCFFSSPQQDLFCNNDVYSDDKQCHSPRIPMGSLAKRLLPFLDAANDDETEEPYSCGWQEEISAGPTESTTMKVSIEEEVDHVYEKLQALETDTEFLRSCMGSTEQGDQKGVNLLQDILQHLRDLKAVELRLNELGDADPLR